jgi:hypothetical protein
LENDLKLILKFLMMALCLLSSVASAQNVGYCRSLISGINPRTGVRAIELQIRSRLEGKNTIEKMRDPDISLAALNQPAVLKELLAVIEYIEMRFPKDEYYIIGMGGSPSPIIAGLQVRNADYARNFPLSIPATTANWQSDRIRSLNGIPPEALNHHFSNMLPPPEVLKGRKVVVLDVVMSGGSLVVGAKAISDFYKSGGRNIQVLSVGFLTPLRWISLRSRAQFTEVISLYALGYELGGQNLKALSEYSSYIPGYSPESKLVPNPAYQRMVDFLKQFFKTP